MKAYTELVAEALDAPFQGWDFSWLHGRSNQVEPSWSYDSRARQLIDAGHAALNRGEGGCRFRMGA